MCLMSRFFLAVCLRPQVELYRKNVWRDAKTVNVIATACFSKEYKVVATALRFFLGMSAPDPEDEVPCFAASFCPACTDGTTPEHAVQASRV
jgi:hypothetical protein